MKAIEGDCVALRLASEWSCDFDPSNPLPEYPRPQMVRSSNNWVSLNGIWEWEASV